MINAPTAIRFRKAKQEDLPAIIRLLADDSLGQMRESLDPETRSAYSEAFGKIAEDPRNHIIIADLDGQVIGCLQVTEIPHLTFCGGTRLQIEGVRVDERFRSRDIGGEMMRWAIDFGRAHDCHLVQLTTNRHRNDAQRFYEKAGFMPSHVGYKYDLTP